LLWIGTDAGLCTYDGKSFRLLKPSDGMTANQVWSIAEDEEQNMWFGSMGEGLYKYNGKQFDRFTKKNGLVEDNIRVLCYSKNFHCLIAGGNSSISTIRGKIITHFPEQLSEKNSFSVVTGMTDAGKFIYITTYGDNNPTRYYPDQNKFISLNDQGKYYPKASFSCFLTSKGDTLFSLYDAGVKIYQKEGILQNDSIGQIYGITEDKRGDLWLASWSYPNRNTKGDVFRYDGKNFKSYKAAFGIADLEVWTVFYDREQDILWVGTLNEGLFRIPFSGITNFPSSYFNLKQQKINDLFVDSKNRLWVSGNKELIQISPDGQFLFINKHPMVLSYRNVWNLLKPGSRDPLSNEILNIQKMNVSLLPDYEKHFDFDFVKVIEDENHSIFIFNRLGFFNLHEYNHKAEYLDGNLTFEELAVTGGDTLIMAGWGRTNIHPNFRISPFKIDHYKDFDPDYYFPFTKDGNPKDVNRMISHNNRCWYACRGSGLWMSQGMHLVNFNKADSMISNDLNDICIDEKEHIIFGSNTGEICFATYEKSRLKIDYRITGDNGLLGSTISWLVADQQGHLWAGTNKGLNCIDLNQLYTNGKFNIRVLDEEEGYMGQSSKKGVMDQDGNLWIGADDQLIRLDTKSFLANDANSGKITLKSLEINGAIADSILIKGLDPRTSLPTSHFRLKYSECDLAFYYDLLNYNNPRKDKFRYMLKGYDETWSQWRSGRKAVYTNLPPGKYSFRVEAVNSRSLAAIDPLEVKFTIDQPWWGLWYLQVLFFMFLLSIGLLIVWKYMEIDRKKQFQKSQIEMKIVHLEMQALQAQMNPHFIFNCVNGIQYYVLANKMDEVLAYLSDFSKVVRESLGNATQKMISLEQEIDFLNSYLRLEKMRFPDKFDYDIRCIEMEEDGIVQLPPMLVQPCVENAIRHGFGPLMRKGHLSIVFEKGGEDLLKCTITDNGIGRDKARNYRGALPTDDRPHSTGITGTRLRLFNSPGLPSRYKIVYTDLSENGNPSGLMVELYLPMLLRKV